MKKIIKLFFVLSIIICSSNNVISCKENNNQKIVNTLIDKILKNNNIVIKGSNLSPNISNENKTVDAIEDSLQLTPSEKSILTISNTTLKPNYSTLVQFNISKGNIKSTISNGVILYLYGIFGTSSKLYTLSSLSVNGKTYIGTKNKGLWTDDSYNNGQYVQINNDNLKNLEIYDIETDYNSNIFLATNNGIWEKDEDEDNYSQKYLKNTEIYSIYHINDKKNIICASTEKGLWISNNNEFDDNIISKNKMLFYKNKLYAATSNGLYYFNEKNLKWSIYDFSKITSLSSKKNIIPKNDDEFYAITSDLNNKIYFAFKSSNDNKIHLSCLDTSNNTIEEISFNQSKISLNISSIYIDSNNNIYVSIVNNGLWIVKNNNDKLELENISFPNIDVENINNYTFTNINKNIDGTLMLSSGNPYSDDENNNTGLWYYYDND